MREKTSEETLNTHTQAEHLNVGITDFAQLHEIAVQRGLIEQREQIKHLQHQKRQFGAAEQKFAAQ